MNHEVFEYLQDAVVILNIENTIEYCNSAFSSLVGVPARRIIGKNKTLSEYLKADDDFFHAVKTATDLEDVKLRECGFSILSNESQVSMQYVFQKSEDSCVVFFRDVSLEKSLNEKYRSQLSQKEAVIDELKIAKEKLQVYSEQLEVLVAERTKDLNLALARQTATMDSLSQGVLTVDQLGRICSPFSKSATSILAADLEGRDFSLIFGLNPNTGRLFDEWLNTTFMDMLPFEDMLPLCPVRKTELNGRILDIDYYPLKIDNSFTQLVVLVTDRTQEVKMAATLESEKQFAQSLVQILRYPTAFKKFLKGSHEMMSRLKRKLAMPQLANTEEIMRDLHTVKGGAASFGLVDVSQMAHQAETHCQNSEIIAARALIGQMSVAIESFKTKIAEFLDLSDVVTFRPLEIVQSFSIEVERLKKSLHVDAAELKIEGQDLELPEAYLPLFQNLIHCVRNSMDHGYPGKDQSLVANPALTESASRPFEMTVRWKQDDTNLALEFSDNGTGIDVEKIRNKLSQKNPFHFALSHSEVLKTLLKGGISSKDEVTDVSGRGVGVGALFSEVQKLGGHIDIQSQPGEGTAFKIQVPLKLVAHSKAA